MGKVVLAAGALEGVAPRLPDQPIFYPVPNEQYAIKIARDWYVPRWMALSESGSTIIAVSAIGHRLSVRLA